MPLPILISRIADGTIQYANIAFGDLLGYSAPELIGQRTPDFYYDPSEREVLLQQLRRDGKVHNYELHIKTRDGTLRWVLVSIQPIEHDGQPALLAALHEVTDRKQIEAALQESQLLLQLVINNIPQALAWKDRDLRFLGCNRRFAADAGLADPLAVVGKTDDDLPAEYGSLYGADDRVVIESGTPKLNFEQQHTRPDGMQSWLRMSKAPLRNSAGDAVGILLMYEDITARKQEEQERARLKDDLIRAQEATLA
jgi:rsbT co-antagonist protein RsbR